MQAHALDEGRQRIQSSWKLMTITQTLYFAASRQQLKIVLVLIKELLQLFIHPQKSSSRQGFNSPASVETSPQSEIQVFESKRRLNCMGWP
jgi:hypothetical protein